ncbi:unnamed protein product [Blepharisma stoltei]|uniref:Maturase K n=1 Tax=Blepharisma stoltei TaxID=1481888 RepID=A0AAU9J087_9CILI|nr:unnamed protein product [Blepharisma stoltei]
MELFMAMRKYRCEKGYLKLISRTADTMYILGFLKSLKHMTIWNFVLLYKHSENNLRSKLIFFSIFFSIFYLNFSSSRSSYRFFFIKKSSSSILSFTLSQNSWCQNSAPFLESMLSIYSLILQNFWLIARNFFSYQSVQPIVFHWKY